MKPPNINSLACRSEWEQLQSIHPVSQSPISTSKRAKTFNNPAVDVAKSRTPLRPTHTQRHFHPTLIFVKYAEEGRGLLLVCVCCWLGFTSAAFCLFSLSFFHLSLGWLYTCLLCYCCVWTCLVWEHGGWGWKSLVDNAL
jgi:hypothetical protein